MRDGRTDERTTTSEDRATQLEALSLAKMCSTNWKISIMVSWVLSLIYVKLEWRSRWHLVAIFEMNIGLFLLRRREGGGVLESEHSILLEELLWNWTCWSCWRWRRWWWRIIKHYHCPHHHHHHHPNPNDWSLRINIDVGMPCALQEIKFRLNQCNRRKLFNPCYWKDHLMLQM